MLASMVFKSSDSTELLNSITKDVLPPGVYSFPGDPNISNDWIIPGTGLQVIIRGPWVVRNIDGMTIRELSGYDHRINFPAQGEFYVGLFSKYLIASDPILELKYISVADYLNWIEKSSFVIFARVIITDSQITSSMIDLTARTFPRGVFALIQDLLSTGSILRTVLEVANLTSGLPDAQINEIVYVQSENAFYKYLGNGGWIRVDAPYNGISNFSSTVGTLIPLANILKDKPYTVFICPTENGGGNIGEWWVVKNALTNTFTVYNNGTATTQFNWQVVPFVSVYGIN